MLVFRYGMVVFRLGREFQPTRKNLTRGLKTRPSVLGELSKVSAGFSAETPYHTVKPHHLSVNPRRHSAKRASTIFRETPLRVHYSTGNHPAVP